MDAYDQGCAARKANRPKESNPYLQHDDRWSEWMDGWEDMNDDLSDGVD